MQVAPFTPSPIFKVGDMVTMPAWERRKWWQFWKPRYGPMKKATYRVVGVTASTINLDD